MAKENIKVSLVITARNDDYGKYFLNRLQAFTRFLIYLNKKYSPNLELIVVEYNPPPDKKYLIDALEIPANNSMPIRFIRVPLDFHKKEFPETKYPFLDYIAKNIGIRRARGEYILSVNPDIIFDDSLIKFLTDQTLKDNVFYRANRHDISIHELDNIPNEQILKVCKEKTTRIWESTGLKYVSYSRWAKRFTRKPSFRNLLVCPAFNFVHNLRGGGPIHDAAAGDFLLAHRDVWEQVQGYSQIPFNSTLDGYILYNLYNIGFKQEVLPFPIYHINHATNIGPKMSSDEYQENIRRLLRDKVLYKMNGEKWGYPESIFEEKVINC